jgi:hypothetical protein
MKTLLAVILLCGAMAAQTVYYNHPKGVQFANTGATVAKLTLPAGTYHVFFKTGFAVPFQNPDGEPEVVNCGLNVTGMPNVPSPYTADLQQVSVRTSSGEVLAAELVMETAFTTTGGTVKAICQTLDRNAFTVSTAYINLSATKISTLIRQ